MHSYHILMLLCLLVPATLLAQRSIVVLGSSTAAGDGATSYDSSWIGRLSRHYKDLGLIDTIYNRAIGGRTTLDCLPTDSLHLGEGQYPYPDTGRNVSKALSYRPLPLLVIVSLPNNDIDHDATETLPQFLANLRVIYNVLLASNVRCIIAGAQPRTDFNMAKRLKVKEANDSIQAEFAHNTLEFWDTLTDHTSVPDSLGLKSMFNAGDGIHLNNLGHLLLYNITISYGNVLDAPLTPLPLTLVNFDVQLQQRSAFITWTVSDEDGPVTFHVQRSADGQHFDDIGVRQDEGHMASISYSWTDDHVLSGKSFYRLRISTDGGDEYSRVVGLLFQQKGWSIQKLYYPGGGNTIVAELALAEDQQLHLSIMNSSGAVIRQQTVFAKAPGTQIPLQLDGMAAGQYFLRIGTDKGTSQSMAFTRF